MSVKIEVKSYDESAKAQRQASALRVVDEFPQLPDLKLLAFFDDEDWGYFRSEFGAGNRGLYTPIKSTNFQWAIWPDYVKVHILVEVPPDFLLRQEVGHVIYVHGTTCADPVGLIMTFSHELQHFVQYGFSRRLWAENYLLLHLPEHVIEATGLNWPDIPNEREARIVAKRIAVKLCGAEAVDQYIADRIDASAAQREAKDWQFSQGVEPSIPYDLPGATRHIFHRLRRHRRHFEDFLVKLRDDVDFANLNLSEYFDGTDSPR